MSLRSDPSTSSSSACTVYYSCEEDNSSSSGDGFYSMTSLRSHSSTQKEDDVANAHSSGSGRTTSNWMAKDQRSMEKEQLVITSAREEKMHRIIARPESPELIVAPHSRLLLLVNQSVEEGEDENKASHPRFWKPLMVGTSLVGVLLLTTADICLHLSLTWADSSTRHSDLWFQLMLRSGLQSVVGAAMTVLGGGRPWGKKEKIPILILMGSVTFILLFGVDVMSKRVSAVTTVAFQLLTPLTTAIFTWSLCLERIYVHRVICLMCVLGAAVMFVFGSGSARMAPLNSEMPFAFMSLDPLGMLETESDMVGLLHAALAPVFASYLLVLVFMCQGIHAAVVLLWMGLGSFAMSIFGVHSTMGFKNFSPNLSANSLALTSVSAFCGTFGTLLFVVAINRAGPVRAIILRSLQLAIAWVISFVTGSNSVGFLLSDLAATVLVGIAVSHVIIDLLFY